MAKPTYMTATRWPFESKDKKHAAEA